MPELTEPLAHAEELSYELAERAYSGTSHFPEKRAKREQESYAEDVNGFYAEMSALCTNDDQRKILAEEILRYKENYLKHYNAYLTSHANVVSSFIAGPANFPVERMNKRADWAHNKMTAFMEWREKARGSIKKKLLTARTPEEIQNVAWAGLKREISRSLATIEEIDAGGSFYTRSAFVSSIAGKIERLAANGQDELVEAALGLLKRYNQDHKKPAFTERHKVWAMLETARKVAAKPKESSPGEGPLFSRDGVEVILNAGIDRVQIFFPGKPEEEMRSKLKGAGWNWSPREGAWQRKATEAAKYSALQIIGANDE